MKGGSHDVAGRGSEEEHMNSLAYIGVSVSIVAGVLGFLLPQQVSKTIGLGLPSQLAISEFRATYGGLFIGAGLAVLIIGSSDAAKVLGAAWAGAFVARAVSVVIDRSRSKENVAGLVIEATVAALLIFG
jgi:hypothetical protein